MRDARRRILPAMTGLVLFVACGHDTGPLPDAPGGAPVEEYLRFAVSGEVMTADTDPQRISEGLRKLAGALGALRLSEPGLQVDLRVAAEHLLLNPSSPETTALVRDGLVSAADALQTAGNGRLRRLAESIRPDVALLDQRATLHQFFQESADVIERVSHSS